MSFHHSQENQQKRWLELTIVLSVAFGEILYFQGLALTQGYIGGVISPRPSQELAGIIAQVTALLVLFYVGSHRNNFRHALGLYFRKQDWIDSLLLLILGYLIFFICNALFANVFSALLGGYPYWLTSHFELSTSFISFVFLSINPVFEELIVRGYLMREVAYLKKSWPLAILLSTAFQTSYHLYQGLVPMVSWFFVFLLFSVYFAEKKRITPLVLAHAYMDWIPSVLHLLNAS